MDPIRNIASAPVQVNLPAPGARGSAPVLPKPSADAGALPSGNDTGFDPVKVEQQRFEAVKQAAQNTANDFVLGDQSFTIFKDATGQYITRFRSLRDGKVTYIPEPQIFRQGGQAAAPLVTLNA